MKRTDILNSIPSGGLCVAFGSFNGLHAGHRSVIERLSLEMDLQKILILFGGSDGRTFYTPEETEYLLRDSGIDLFAVLPYDPFGRMSRETFVREILCGRLHAAKVITGAQDGALPSLKKMAGAGLFDLVTVPVVTCGGQEVSSGILRKKFESGDFDGILSLLGYPYILQGRVVHGSGSGHRHAMPTANLELPACKMLPPFGVYGSVTGFGNRRLLSATNVGPRPSVSDSGRVTVETFIPNYSGDLYGSFLTVELFRFVRGIMKFPGGLDEVHRQVERDLLEIRSYAEKHGVV